MVDEIKKKTKDWFDQLFGDWGLSGWVRLAVKTGLLILLLILIIAIAFGLIRKITQRLITSTTSSLSMNNVWMNSPPLEEIEMQNFPPEEEEEEEPDPEDFRPEAQGQWPMPFRQWPTNQSRFGELYPDSEYLAPQPQFFSS